MIFKRLRKENVFSYLQNEGKAKWKAARRFRILKLFAWVYQIYYCVIKISERIRKGKPLIKEISEGNEYKKLLRKLGI